MDTLGFDTATRWKFLRGNDAETFQVYGLGEETPLQRGTRLVAFALYGEALQVFRSAFDAAQTSGDLRFQVLSAERLAWFYSELEQYAEAHYWIDKSIATVEACLHASVEEIASSIRESQAREADLDLVNVLSRVLHFRGKMLTVRALHDLQSELPQLEMRRKAAEAFARSRMLDERLPTSAHLGHDLRWNAVLLSVDPDVRLQEVQSLLSASQERFSRGSFAHVLLLREQGVVRWQMGKVGTAQAFLSDAAEGLALLGDARALGASFCVLSKTILAGAADRPRARRYALAAAILHPFGYVLDHYRSLLSVDQRELQSDLDALRNEERPFNLVHTVFSQLAASSATTKGDLLERHLTVVRANRNGRASFPFLAQSSAA
jgi:hypothetical protein